MDSGAGKSVWPKKKKGVKRNKISRQEAQVGGGKWYKHRGGG